MQLATPTAPLFTTFGAPAPEWRHLDIPHRIARVFKRICDRFGDPDYPVSLDELAGEIETEELSEAEIREHRGAAARLIHDATTEPPAPVYDREARVQLGSSLILGMMPAVATCHTTLREANFTNTELGDLWDEIIARAADAFHADRAPLRPTGSAVGRAGTLPATDRTERQTDSMPDWGRVMLERNAE